MRSRPLQVILCNGADPPNNLDGRDVAKVLRLDYRGSPDAEQQTIRVLLPYFVRGVYFLPDRILDLLEIAAYVFSADRLVVRGRKDDLEYHSWSRSFHFSIRVRDSEFWQASRTRSKLARALEFMTGDREYTFTFQPGHSTPPTGLFDHEEFGLNTDKPVSVLPFSGGLDSLCGAIERLETSDDHVCLVSHQSGHPGTRKTQNSLVAALRKYYPNRVTPYKFCCGNTGARALEESQRTRAFLYSSIAFSLCQAYPQMRFFVYENGVTALNFPRREDLQNARASRTTHPKTLWLLQDFFSEVRGSPIAIETPFLWKTKGEVLGILKEYGYASLISSSVSCSRTFKAHNNATHCGGCYQCVDRKFASYAAGLDDYDEGCGVYAHNFIKDRIEDGEEKTILADYVRQAANFATCNIDGFYSQTLRQLVDITDYVPGMREEDVVDSVYDLVRRHGQQVATAMRRMRESHDDLFRVLPEGSFLQMINQREYLREPVDRLVEDVCRRLRRAVPIAFQDNWPKNESDLNDKVSAIIESERCQFEREHPAVRFATAHVVPDHSSKDCDLFIEAKYIRESTTPSKASDGIAADLIKYPESTHVLFVVYDPTHSIVHREDFKKDFERKRPCTVLILP